MPTSWYYLVDVAHIKSNVLNHFCVPFHGREQPPPGSESRGEGSAAYMLRLQPPIAKPSPRTGPKQGEVVTASPSVSVLLLLILMLLLLLLFFE